MGATILRIKIADSAGFQQFALILWQPVFLPIFLAIIRIYNGLPTKLRVLNWTLLVVISFTGALIPGVFSLTAVSSYGVEGNFAAKYGLRGPDLTQTLLWASLPVLALVQRRQREIAELEELLEPSGNMRQG